MVFWGKEVEKLDNKARGCKIFLVFFVPRLQCKHNHSSDIEEAGRENMISTVMIRTQSLITWVLFFARAKKAYGSPIQL